MAGSPSPDADSLLQVELSDGRTIWCWQYLATCTYANFPIREQSESAREYLQRHIEHEAETLFGKSPLHVVLPAGDQEFPPYRFLGEFTSAPVQSKDVSVLAIAWFQNSPFPALDEATRETIKQLDWSNLACDIEC